LKVNEGKDENYFSFLPIKLMYTLGVIFRSLSVRLLSDGYEDNQRL
jgi:hypothetical protein